MPKTTKSKEVDDKLRRELQSLTDRLSKFMEDYGSRIQALEGKEDDLKKAGLKKDFNALAKVLDDVNKRFETINGGGKVYARYV